MFPISDDRTIPGVPYVTWALAGACAAIFLWQFGLTEKEAERAIQLYGMVPARLFGEAHGVAGAPAGGLPPWATVLTSMFMHGSLAHIGGNMLYLWIFGDNVELAMGRLKFLAFYLICGVAAALMQGLQSPGSTVPLIGASGAISGVLGAYLVLTPFARVRVAIMPLPFVVRIVSIPALLVLGLWFVMQFLSGLMSNPEEGGVAFWAHVGGFVAGMALTPLFRIRGVRLFQPASPRVFDARRETRESRGRDDRGPWGRRRGPWGD